MFLTPEELMAGGSITHDIEIPQDVLYPDGNGKANADQQKTVNKMVKMKPLTVKDVQLIAKAAKDDEVLTSVLMIREAVVEPQLKQGVIAKMHSGLVRFLVDRINRISGLTTSEDELQEIADSPIVRAFFVLAKEFNWTPQQVKEMTVGQILGYLELLNQSKGKV
ncbi:MAG: hypothetical protein JSV88_27265 [Candidatus Aminicenantes bacterium]|nr:MAG: hypothetical protein JSV88_27265 [Candidatus Aminicenantes bacterium]